MNASALLNLIPESQLEFLSAETKVDHQVKKLTGATMFRLILFSMINSNKASLRIMEGFYHSSTFRALSGKENSSTKYNSIRDRITNIKAEYFEEIFHYTYDKFSSKIKEGDSLMRFDSTMVALSSRLVDWGMKVGHKTEKKQLKYTVGMKGSFPCHVDIYKNQKELSEDKTIPESILNFQGAKDGIVVFDRGVSSRKSYERFSDERIQFVTRTNTNIVYKELEKKKVKRESTDQILIKEDVLVLLKGKDHEWMKNSLRLVKAVTDTKTEIYFLTNIKDATAQEIAALYKRRWEIEVFFKFLKQELNLSHLVSRTENGIKVMIYMTLILAILIISYKKINRLKGYKIPKLKFAQELESAIIKEIVVLCGGQPSKMSHLFSDS